MGRGKHRTDREVSERVDRKDGECAISIGPTEATGTRGAHDGAHRKQPPAAVGPAPATTRPPSSMRTAGGIPSDNTVQSHKSALVQGKQMVASSATAASGNSGTRNGARNGAHMKPSGAEAAAAGVKPPSLNAEEATKDRNKNHKTTIGRGKHVPLPASKTTAASGNSAAHNGAHMKPSGAEAAAAAPGVKPPSLNADRVTKDRNKNHKTTMGRGKHMTLPSWKTRGSDEPTQQDQLGSRLPTNGKETTTATRKRKWDQSSKEHDEALSRKKLSHSSPPVTTSRDKGMVTASPQDTTQKNTMNTKQPAINSANSNNDGRRATDSNSNGMIPEKTGMQMQNASNGVSSTTGAKKTSLAVSSPSSGGSVHGRPTVSVINSTGPPVVPSLGSTGVGPPPLSGNLTSNGQQVGSSSGTTSNFAPVANNNSSGRDTSKTSGSTVAVSKSFSNTSDASLANSPFELEQATSANSLLENFGVLKQTRHRLHVNFLEEDLRSPYSSYAVEFRPAGRKPMSIGFTPQGLTSDMFIKAVRRLECWESAWRLNWIAQIGATSIVGSTDPAASTAAQLDVCLEDPCWPQRAKRTMLNVKRDAWGDTQLEKPKKPDPNEMRLLLMAVPENPNKTKRADTHLWPKGTFLQITSADTGKKIIRVRLDQRKQQSHNKNEWKG